MYTLYTITHRRHRTETLTREYIVDEKLVTLSVGVQDFLCVQYNTSSTIDIEKFHKQTYTIQSSNIHTYTYEHTNFSCACDSTCWCLYF